LIEHAANNGGWIVRQTAMNLRTIGGEQVTNLKAMRRCDGKIGAKSVGARYPPVPPIRKPFTRLKERMIATQLTLATGGYDFPVTKNIKQGQSRNNFLAPESKASPRHHTPFHAKRHR
jgi:hypothetical protein